ncbi:hypothetical protein NH8B_0579 [Pseudogulbenkiania sp. NH8B]|uniref:hypothetical protein n=1 Tax=Pseudogulbenkiania sp. (strain NH8B) TaxID=748280 RepID=UPI0002279583|nr:hypothetical protein [Pseudogulbenkiania sp. NH8B]BAK75414.1 hypothetical protein NH8B_0579 [Pseudogulbenkiania sp. NH8B]
MPEEMELIAKAIDSDVSQRLGDELPAAEALIFVTRLYRSTGKKDLAKTIAYMRQHSDMTPYSDDELQAWAKVHRVGWYREISGFEQLLANLKAIPQNRRASVKATALRIAAGAGRKPLSPGMAQELAALFPADLSDPTFDPEQLHRATWGGLNQEAESY